jgi:hypothetical protein
VPETKRPGRVAAWGSALLSAMMLLIVCGLLAGGLLYSDRFITAKASAPVVEPAKVGPTFSTRNGMAPARSAMADAPRPEPKPAAEPVQAAAPLPAPVLVATPAVVHAAAPRIAQPSAADPAAEPQAERVMADAAPAPRNTAPEKAVKKLLCTTFKTYDPQSGTYRGFDGQIKPCRQD